MTRDGVAESAYSAGQGAARVILWRDRPITDTAERVRPGAVPSGAMKNRRNYYRVLQVQPGAPAAIIKASYRAMLQRLKLRGRQV